MLNKNGLILLEWNEVNFDLLKSYVQEGGFKNLEQLLEMEICKTFSEKKYEDLEPWIQWASVHTGLTGAQHKIFRLGDIINFNGDQIFEKLERDGIRVGAISPMNTKNAMVSPCYFIPDPWTKTNADPSTSSRQIYTALQQAINDNASGKITLTSVFFLIINFVRYHRSKNLTLYLRLFFSIRKKKWAKPLFLDLFLSDLHIKYFKKYKPDFSTLFLNGFAHLQHHYYFSSRFYNGEFVNPERYVEPNIDPFDDALLVYDRIIGDFLETFRANAIIIATGLQQVPYSEEKFYYRLCDHEAFLKKINLPSFEVVPRMTRDFLINFTTTADTQLAKKKLEAITLNSIPFFGEIDNRGTSLFVTLTYPGKINKNDRIEVSNEIVKIFDHVAFVAIKNGMHDPTGTAITINVQGKSEIGTFFHVSKIFQLIKTHFTKEI